MEMRTTDVYNNLKNYSCWDYKNYRLTKDEADKCVDALRCAIWHEVELEGLPKEDGLYICTCSDGIQLLQFKDNLPVLNHIKGDHYRNLVASNIIAWAYCPDPF